MKLLVACLLLLGAVALGEPLHAQPLATNASADVAVPDAQPPFIQTRKFAARSAVREVEISPDGSRITFFSQNQSQTEFFVADSATRQTQLRFFLPDGFDVLGYRWAGNDRVLITSIGLIRTDRYIYRLRRLFIASLADGRVLPVIADPFLAARADILHVAEDGQWAVIAHPHAEKADYPSVYRYDLTTGQQSAYVHPMIEGVSDWSTDNAGALRLGIGRIKGEAQIWYRGPSAEEFELVERFPVERRSRFFEPLEIEANSDLGFASRRGANGRVGLYRFDFAKRTPVSPFYENPDWNIHSVWMDQSSPLATTYVDDARQTVWFDETIASQFEQLRAALGGEGIRLRLTSFSKDRQKMVFWAGSESDPGVLYLFDRSKMALDELAQLRPDLDFQQLASPKPIQYEARDGTKIHGYLTLPRGRAASQLPLVIRPHGGPYGVRDTLTYNDEVQLLANRGYAVLQPNFRGSGGYGDEFFDLGEGEIGRKMQDDLDDAMDWAIAEGIADPQRVCVIGGSYGGYAALWAVLRNPERYRCAASWAGVTDWDRQLKHDRRFLTRYDRRKFRSRVKGDDGFRLSSVSPARLGKQLQRPVLLAHGTRDGIVPFRQFEEMDKATKDAPVPPTTLIVHGSGHSFFRERDQKLWFDALDAFLAEHNPADQVDAQGNLIVPTDDGLQSVFKPLFGDKDDDELGAQQ